MHTNIQSNLAIEESGLPGFCQGNGVVLKAVSLTATGYSWSTGDTSAAIQADASGAYSVTASFAGGCTASASYSLSYNASKWLSGYVIIANKEANFRRSAIQSGGVGVRAETGKSKYEMVSNVIAPGTFVKARNILVMSGSSVTNKIPTNANIALPVFEYNTLCGSGLRVITRDNVNVTLTGSHYKSITIGKNSIVTFTSPDISVDDIFAKDNVTIRFTSHCARLKVCKKLHLGNNNTFNPDGNDVTAFVEQDVTIKGGSTVTTDIYMNSGKMTVGNAPSNDHTIMTGLFIVNMLESGENTEWNQNTDCADCENISQPLCDGDDRKVVSFTLVNSNTDLDIRDLTDGDVIDICTHPVSIRANVCNENNIESVRFLLNGSHYKMENINFYTIAGNNGNNYSPWNVSPGSYTITATPYSGNNGTGAAGESLSITVTVAGCSTSN